MKNSKKGRVYDKIWEVKRKHEKLDDRLEALYQQEKITGGARYYTKDSFSNAGIRLFRKQVFPWGYDKTTKTELETLLDMAKQDYQEALEFVEEQEAATLENCQLAKVRRKKAEETRGC